MTTSTSAHDITLTPEDDADALRVWRAECVPCEWAADDAHADPDDATADGYAHATATDEAAASLVPDLPVEWDVTALAATVVWDLANSDTNVRGTSASDTAWGRGRVSGVMAAWQSLTGIHDRAQAIDLAERYASATSPVIALTPPF